MNERVEEKIMLDTLDKDFKHNGFFNVLTVTSMICIKPINKCGKSPQSALNIFISFSVKEV